MFSPEFWFKALELVLALSVLVFVHELGHFMWSRIFKVGVEKFYLFFDAGGFALVRWNKEGFHLFDFIHFPRFKNPSDTEYGIGWLPLGGYCAIVGMVDETHDAEHAETDRPDAFVKAHKFKQFMIMVGGVLNNVLFACLLYICIAWIWGKDIVEQKNLPYGVVYSDLAHQIGFEDNDLIVALDGKEIRDFNRLGTALLLGNEVTVSRQGNLIDIALPDTLGVHLLANPRALSDFVEPRMPFVIHSVVEGSVASLAGLVEGDSIIGVGHYEVGDSLPELVMVPTSWGHEVRRELAKHASDTVVISYFHADSLCSACAVLGEDGKLGVLQRSLLGPECLTHLEYSLFEAIPAGISQGWTILGDYVRQFKLVFTREGAKQMGGFGTMGKIMPSAWDWLAFWRITAFFSIALAFMNILPIPGLDGGHIFILVIEAVLRRPLSDKVKERLQMFGFILVLLLMVAVNLNDIIKAFF